jgi:hypothetical protein
MVVEAGVQAIMKEPFACVCVARDFVFHAYVTYSQQLRPHSSVHSLCIEPRSLLDIWTPSPSLTIGRLPLAWEAVPGTSVQHRDGRPALGAAYVDDASHWPL